MNKERIITYLKLVAGMVLSFFISTFLVQHVFSNYSPTVRKNLPQYIGIRTTLAINSVRALFPGSKPTIKQPTLADLQNIATQIAPGVKASEIENHSYTEIDEDEIEFKTVEVELSNGTKVKVKIPKHEKDPPPIELIEASQ